MTRPVPFPPLPDLQRSPRRAPIPVGPLTGKRSGWRRAAALACAAINRVLDCAPPTGRWLHRWVQRDLEVTELELPIAGAGQGLHGVRVALITDVHAGSFMSEGDLCRIFARVAALEPDLVCLGGDLINTREREILLLRAPLALLRPPLGIYAVPGNHDHFYGSYIGLWEAYLRDQGVRVLINQGQRVHRGADSLWIAGVDDLTEGVPDLAAALAGRRADEPTLLLSHHPDFFFEAAAAGVHLTLSGHTHGGQIKVFGRSPLRHSAFGWQEGLFEEEGARLYVSRGVGVTFLPVRIGAKPEIPLLRLAVPAPVATPASAPQSYALQSSS